MSFKIYRKSLVNLHDICADYEGVIEPKDIQLDGIISHAEIMQADHKTRNVSVALLRTYMQPEIGETQLVLSQHISTIMQPVMGFTAYTNEIGRLLDHSEQQIARNAVARLARAEKQRRKNLEP